MAFHRPYLYAALAALPLSLLACGSSGGGGNNPTGMHYHYVTNQLLVPTNNQQAHDYGLDLDGNGSVDNQLGSVLGTLAGMGFDIQGTVDIAVLDGSVIFLADVQTTDFTNASNAGFQVYLGTNPQPPACMSGEMPTCTTAMPPVCTGCGHHLTGSGMFTIDPNGPMNAALTGNFASGNFTAGPGTLTLPLTLAGANLKLNLIGARVKASGVTNMQIGSSSSGGAILAGALTQDDLNNQVLPAIGMALGPLIQRDCCGLPTSPGGATCNPSGSPACGCTSGSTGATILGLFDGDDGTAKDCMVSVAEIKGNTLIQSLLAPDVTIDGKMALSLGVKMTAVGAQF